VLEEMRIRGLGVIEDATLQFGPGLTVLTGETGAGKTMVVSGLTLLLGARADTGLVRAGTARASVEGRLQLPPGAPVLARAADAGAEIDEDGSLILARTVLPEGRSRAHVGGRSVPVGVLAELCDPVLAVHGQSDQMALLRPVEQRAALDRYAGAPVADLREDYRKRFTRWQECARALADRTGRVRELRAEAEVLRRGLAEIAEVDPRPGEDDDLDAEAARLANADALRVAAQTAHESLTADPADGAGEGVDATVLVAAARRALEHTDDPELTGLAERLAEVGRLVADLAADLGSYLDGLDADPGRLAAIEQRRAELRSLTRSYADPGTGAGGVAGVLAWADDAERRLADLDPSDDALAALAADRDSARQEAAALAGRLSRARAKAGKRFATAVTAELAGLAMPDAQVQAQVRPRPVEAGAPTLTVDGAEVTAGPDGVDEVTLLFRSHRGAPARPIQRAASGGELSRVMLAVEVVFADADPVTTMVFDEVDAGVGGQAATEVGRRLARLATSHQVIVVTHLPQVAAYADQHLVVDKDDAGTITRSGVRALAAGERTRELARMLAGLADSELGQAHAEELLDAAARGKVRG
jgi:DNA repair protein RecN (Recombination protein N)